VYIDDDLLLAIDLDDLDDDVEVVHQGLQRIEKLE